MRFVGHSALGNVIALIVLGTIPLVSGYGLRAGNSPSWGLRLVILGWAVIALALGAGVWTLIDALSGRRPTPIPRATAAAPPQPDPPPPARDEKVILPVAPRELCDIYRTHTTIQADVLAKPYLGKWVRVSGHLDDLHDSHGDLRMDFSYEDWNRHQGVMVNMTFNKGTTWVDVLPVMKKGQAVKVLGRIGAFGATTLELVDCELEP